MRPTRAMVLAAGLGLRMRPLTEDRPKPLVEVQCRSLLDRVLDRLVEAGVKSVVVNTHYRARQIADHLAGRKTPKVTLLHEDPVLETGGGVLNALPHLGKTPFFVVNSDALWLNGTQNALLRLADQWKDEAMDGLLLLHRTVRAFGLENDSGDFLMDPEGRVRRRAEREIAPFVFTGIQLLHPRLFEGSPTGPFSLNRLYDRAIENGRLWGLVHDGEWYHVGTPDQLRVAEEQLRAHKIE